MIKESTIDRLRHTVDIVSVAENYVVLKKSGANFKANCPLHGEKTPSFVVSPGKQIYHCFGCLAPHEEIRTTEGLKEIRNIEVGDEVYASSGKVTKVTAKIKHEPQYDMLQFKADLMNNWSVFTANHDMLIVSKKEILEKLPYIRVERNRPQKFYGNIKNRKHINPIVVHSEVVFAQDVKEGDYFIYPVNRDVLNIKEIELGSFWKKKKFGPNVTKIESVKITSDLMWMFGLYIAEGSTYRGGIRFSLHSKELDYANRVVKVLKSSFNKSASLFYPKGRENSLEVTCSSTNLEYVFKGLFSRGAENICYPYYFNYLEERYRRALLSGLMDGDGCYGSNTYTTISRDLAYSFVDLAIGLEKIPALYIKAPCKDKNGLKHKASYDILLRKRESLKSFFEEVQGVKYLFMRIKEIKEAPKEDIVYDITVEDSSHTFLTKSFIVGNCGSGGDSIKLVMEIEKLSYPEAIEKLCDEYNIPVEYENSGRDVKKLSTNGLELYSKWCYINLKSNKEAMSYLRSRGVSDKSIDDFEIGYSPSSSEVVSFMRSTPIPIPEAIEVGILGSGKSNTYAIFSNRIMFPIRDHTGKLCGFSGRTTIDHAAKYLNTKDTPLFNKSTLLYGLDKAKDKVSKLGYFIVSEGQMDVVMLHQVGITQSFASMGTALTDQQIKRIKRYAKRGIVAYDGDKAGRLAAFKASELLMINMVDSKVVMLGDNEDPADMISSGHVSDIKKLLSGGVSSIEFTIDVILKKYNLTSPFDRTEAIKDIGVFASKMSPVVQDDIVSRAEKIIGNKIKIDKVSLPDDIPPPMAEMEIIKAVMLSENEAEIKELESAVKCFTMQSEIFMLKNHDYSSKSMTSIFLDDRIVPSADVMSDIALLKIWCMKRYLLKIQHNDSISAEKKIIMIREAQVKIYELEKRKENT